MVLISRKDLNKRMQAARKAEYKGHLSRANAAMQTVEAASISQQAAAAAAEAKKPTHQKVAEQKQREEKDKKAAADALVAQNGRKQRIENLVKENKLSVSDIGASVGLSTEETQRYLSQYHPKYKEKNPLQAVGSVLVEGGKAAVRAVSTPGEALAADFDKNTQKAIQSDYNAMIKAYQDGAITRAALEEKFNKNYGHLKGVVGELSLKADDKKGLVRMNKNEQAAAMAGTTAQAGVDVASVLPAGKGVNVAEKLIAEGLKSGTRTGVKTAVGSALKLSAAEAALYGTAQTGVDAARGNLSVEGTLGNYGAPLILGAGSRAIGGVAGNSYLKAKGIAVDQGVGKKVASVVGKVADKTGVNSAKVSQKLDLVGEQGVLGFLDKQASRGIKKAGYAIQGGIEKVPGVRNVNTFTDSFMTKMVTSNHQLYKVLKRSDFDGKTTNAYAIAREAIGNSYRAPAYAERWINENPNLQAMTKGMEAKAPKGIVGAKNMNTAVGSFDEYAKIRSELDLVNANKKDYGKKHIAELEGRLKAVETDWAPEYDNLVKAYKDLNDFRLEEGLISKDLYDEYANNGLDYVRQQRELDSWKLDAPGGKTKGSAASIGKSSLDQKRSKKASAELLSPTETMIRTVQVAHAEALRNRAAKTITGILTEAGEGKMLRTTDIVREKQGLLKELHTSKPVVNKMVRTVRTQSKQLRRLQAEIDSLNHEGLNKRLKKGGTNMDQGFAPAGLGGDVATSQTGKLNKKATDEFTDLVSQAERAKPGTAKANGLKQDVIIEGAGTKAQTAPSKLGAMDTRKFVQHLVTMDSREFQLIRSKIENRSGKHSALFDQLEYMNKDLNDMYAKRKGLWTEANNLKVDVKKANTPHISFVDDGVENIMQVDPHVASAIHDWGQEYQNFMIDFMRRSNNIFKYGTTSANIGFALPNFVADQMGSAINSKSAMSTHNPVNFLHAAFATAGFPLNAKEAEWLALYNQGNARQLSINQYTKPDQAGQVAREMVRRNSSKSSRAYTVVTSWNDFTHEAIKHSDNVVGYTEDLTRYQNFRGTMKRAEKLKMSKEAALKNANLAARENTTDFLEAGTWGRVINSAVPYFNAATQGNRTIGRNLVDRPVTTAAKLAVTVGTPVAVSTAWNLSDPDRKAIYDDIPEYMKETNFIYIGPGAKYNEATKKYDGVFMMKKPPGAKEFAEPIRKFLEYQASNDPSKVKGILGFIEQGGGEAAADFGQAFTPVNFESPEKFFSSVTPQLMKPTAEAILNRNFFQESDIVSKKLLDTEDPANQKYADYSMLTAHIAGMFNTSPLRVDHWIKGTFGEVGTNAQYAVDRFALQAPEEAIGGRSLEETVSRRFVAPQGGAVTDTFYDQYYKPALTQKTRTNSKITQLLKEGRNGEAKELAQKFNASLVEKLVPFKAEYGDTPNYSADFDERFDALRISDSDAAFKARLRNN